VKKTGPRLAALFALLVSRLNSRLDSLLVATKAVLNVETYLRCSQDLRGTQHGLWPGLSPTFIYRITEGLPDDPPSIGNNRISSLLNRAAVMNRPSGPARFLRDSTRILSSTRGRNRKVHDTRIRRGLPRTALSHDHKIIANAWSGSGWNS